MARRKHRRAPGEVVSPRGGAGRRSGSVDVKGPGPLSPKTEELSDFEYGLVISSNAFFKWVARCMAAAGVTGLGPHDIILLHTVNCRARGRKLADICLVMNIEDPYVVSYSLKKLVAGGLVSFERRGREKYYTTTAKGDEVCLRYHQVRHEWLGNSLNWLQVGGTTLAVVAGCLKTMSALYGRAAQLATVNDSLRESGAPRASVPGPSSNKHAK